MLKLNAMFRRLALVLSLVALVAASGCSGKKKADETGNITGSAADENTLGDSDSGKAFGLKTIHFGYDSFVLDSESKAALKANAAVMTDKSTLKIQVEGHCDQHGGIQYNIALGEKRANSVKKYLMDQGVKADRITTISYGKERPADAGTSAEADAKNRRANFVITSR